MLNECKLTEFGLAVKTEILKRGLSQEQLIELVQEKTGLYIDRGYMYKILTGKRSPENIVAAIREILGLEA